MIGRFRTAPNIRVSEHGRFRTDLRMGVLALGRLRTEIRNNFKTATLQILSWIYIKIDHFKVLFIFICRISIIANFWYLCWKMKFIIASKIWEVESREERMISCKPLFMCYFSISSTEKLLCINLYLPDYGPDNIQYPVMHNFMRWPCKYW